MECQQAAVPLIQPQISANSHAAREPCMSALPTHGQNSSNTYPEIKLSACVEHQHVASGPWASRQHTIGSQVLAEHQQTGAGPNAPLHNAIDALGALRFPEQPQHDAVETSASIEHPSEATDTMVPATRPLSTTSAVVLVERQHDAMFTPASSDRHQDTISTTATARSTSSSFSSSSFAPQAIFDFDNTLTRVMVFDELVRIFSLGSQNAPTGQDLGETAQAMSDQWWVDAFGGRERIVKLNNMLSSLRAMDVKCYVCSMNVDTVIVVGLGRVGLLQHFQRSEKEIRIIPPGLPNKGLRVQRNLQLRGGVPMTTVFIDDDSKNIAKVAELNPGIGQVHCSSEGLTEQECEGIVTHFQNMVAVAWPRKEEAPIPQMTPRIAGYVAHAVGLPKATEGPEAGSKAATSGPHVHTSVEVTTISDTYSDTAPQVSSTSHDGPRMESGQRAGVQSTNGCATDHDPEAGDDLEAPEQFAVRPEAITNVEMCPADRKSSFSSCSSDGRSGETNWSETGQKILRTELVHKVGSILGQAIEVKRSSGMWQVGSCPSGLDEGGINSSSAPQKSNAPRNQATVLKMIPGPLHSKLAPLAGLQPSPAGSKEPSPSVSRQLSESTSQKATLPPTPDGSGQPTPNASVGPSPSASPKLTPSGSGQPSPRNIMLISPRLAEAL